MKERETEGDRINGRGEKSGPFSASASRFAFMVQSSLTDSFFCGATCRRGGLWGRGWQWESFFSLTSVFSHGFLNVSLVQQMEEEEYIVWMF
jgi:hypothetical protein